MTAESIARLLSGRRVGSAWMAKCPAHDDREPSLSIREADNGKVLVRCHAGCEQVQLIAVLKARGIWSETARRHYSTIDSNSVVTNRPNRGDAKRTQAALHMWEATLPANGTLVETYLSSRNIIIPAPPALRFHAGLKHPSGGIWPAMVALVTNGADATPIAVHRTFLARDGRRKAPVEPTKMMLGPCRGGAVRLGAIGDQLMIAEGIETALSAMQATGKAAWAALSTSGLRGLDLPKNIRNVIVLADGDEPGEAAAQGCARCWAREDRRVRIARPPQGMDFNDMLLGSALSTKEGAL